MAPPWRRPLKQPSPRPSPAKTGEGEGLAGVKLDDEVRFHRHRVGHVRELGRAAETALHRPVIDLEVVRHVPLARLRAIEHDGQLLGLFAHVGLLRYSCLVCFAALPLSQGRSSCGRSSLSAPAHCYVGRCFSRANSLASVIARKLLPLWFFFQKRYYYCTVLPDAGRNRVLARQQPSPCPKIKNPMNTACHRKSPL